MKWLFRWAITAFSLFVAAWIVPGIRVEGDAWLAYAVTAAILSLVNIYLKPLLKLLSCSLIILTLGLFLLVINGFALWLTSAVAVNWFHIGFYVDGFWAAFWGGLIVGFISLVLSVMLKERESRPQ
ncbi:MAG TPA: phage holin family protein [bacterium]|jgi:putative membrane protein